MANKYHEAASKLVDAICDIMNLFYKEKEARAFRNELLSSIQNLGFNGERWVRRGE